MQDDRLYFYRRAEAEIRMAEKATTPQAVHAHYRLAERYLDRANGDGSGTAATSEQVQSHLATHMFMLQV